MHSVNKATSVLSCGTLPHNRFWLVKNMCSFSCSLLSIFLHLICWRITVRIIPSIAGIFRDITKIPLPNCRRIAQGQYFTLALPIWHWLHIFRLCSLIPAQSHLLRYRLGHRGAMTIWTARKRRNGRNGVSYAIITSRRGHIIAP